jgi:hypothetical protein
MKHDESLSSIQRVQRRRWLMRQRSRLFRLLGLPIAASMQCPYCQAKVAEGDFFCCSELEQAWAANDTQNIVEPVLAANHF